MAANGFFIFHSADSLAALSLLRSVIPDYGAILFRALADKFDYKKKSLLASFFIQPIKSPTQVT